MEQAREESTTPPPGGMNGHGSPSAAFERVVSASEQIITTSAELIRLDFAKAMQSAGRSLALYAAAALLLCGAWFALVAIVLALPGDQVSMSLRLAVVALLNALAGGIAIVGAMRRSGAPKLGVTGGVRARERQ